MLKRTSFTFDLTGDQQVKLTETLRSGNYKPVTVEHTSIAVEKDDCRINLYKSGKCLVQGQNAEDFVAFVLEPLVLQEARLGYDEVRAPEMFTPHMGVDESGKGDFFGPMVIAAVHVDRDLVVTMRDMNVRDSKLISSDRVALDLARDLRKLLGEKFAMVTIGPVAYNRLYASMRNVNRILAWAHARAIENLLERVPSCPMALSDQFGNKSLVLNALMKNGRKIRLEQRHRAESDPAVAAASVLARAGFLLALKEMEKRFEVHIPKGASAAVKEAAVELLKKQNNPAILLETSKCHFRTTDQVLGMMNLSRSVLGSEGAAMSRPAGGGFRHHRRKDGATGATSSEHRSPDPKA